MSDLFEEFNNVPVKMVPKPFKTIVSNLTKITTTPVSATASAPVIANQKKAVEEESHQHPATQSGKFRVEKAYVTNSAGGDFTEGCNEHYYDRIVAVDDEVIEEKTLLDDITEENVYKYLILGEILNHPKFRK